MKNRNKILVGIYSIAVLSLVFASPVLAADSADADASDKAQESEQSRVTKLAQADNNDNVLEEVITTGTRSSRPRSAADSTVPVDVLSGEDFNAYGGTADLTDNLKIHGPIVYSIPGNR